MTRDKQLFFISSLFVLASLLALAFFVDQPRSALDDEETSTVIGDDATAALDSGQARRSGDVPALGNATGAEAADRLDHVPRFGDAIFTGDARVLFDVRDAREQILPESANLTAELYRVESGVRIHENPTVDPVAGLVSCVGAAGEGLEPGHYAMRLRAGPYGAIWKDFEVARGQRFRETILLEAFTRVIKLRFVDAEGRPLPRLAAAPIYAAENVKIADRPLARGPGLLLREPPGEEEVGATVFGGGGAGSTGTRRRSGAFATLDGCWFLQVAAGAEGKLRIPLSESRDGLGTIEIKSRFLEAEWDDYVIRLAPSDEHAARLSRYPLENPDDPGHQSDLVVPRARENPGNPRDWESSLRDWARIIVQGPAQAPADLRLQVEEGKFSNSLRHMDRTYRDRRARFEDGVWFSDVKIGRAEEELCWHWHDGALLETERRSIPQADYLGVNRVVERFDTFEVMPLRVALGPISPTVDAWARAFVIGWGQDRSDRRPGRRDGSELALETAVTRDRNGQARFGSTLVIELRGDARWSRAEIRLPFTAAMGAEAESGRLTIRPRPRGLVLRCLDEDSRALPWVEGSIMELDHLDLALRVRDLLAASGVSVELQTPFLASNLDRKKLEQLDESSDMAGIPEQMGQPLWDALGEAEARLLVARNGAWYDPWRKLRGDDRGYVIDFDQELEAGRRYVLWLWSRSRDAYKPDRMIVFTAAEGLTDLGLIDLPRWRRD